MAFTARVEVTKCDNCPHKSMDKDGVLEIQVCSMIKSRPPIEYNGIRSDCPFNRGIRNIDPISDYVKKVNKWRTN